MLNSQSVEALKRISIFFEKDNCADKNKKGDSKVESPYDKLSYVFDDRE